MTLPLYLQGVDLSTLPVMADLERRNAEAIARLRDGLTLVETGWAAPEALRLKRAEALQVLLEEALKTAEALCRPLPETTVCLCPACRRVTLPRSGGGYAHCGVDWQYHRANNYRPLPWGFWLERKEGDPVSQKLLSEEQQVIVGGETA